MQRIPGNAKQAEIAAVSAVHLGAQATLNLVSPEGEKPDIEQGHGQGQAAQTGSTTPSNTATPPGTNQPRSTGAAQPQTTQPRQSSTNPA